jgi:SH3 domain-containing protein
MAEDVAIPVSPASVNLAGRTVRNGPNGFRHGRDVPGRTPPQGYADNGPTPFFDLLQAMIEAHAAESARTLQKLGATGRIDSMPNIAKASCRAQTDRAPLAANRRWLNVCVVGLIVAVGGVVYASEAGEEQPPAIAAGEAFQARSVVIGNAPTDDKPLEAGKSNGSRMIGLEQERMDEGGIGADGTSGANSNERTAATSVVGQPIEKLGSDTENRADGVAGERMPSEAVGIDSIAPAMNASAEEPSRVAVSLPPVSSETRSAVDRAKDPIAIQVGRVISGVNMRAGPGNNQPVLATIPPGSAIEVIKCRQWCEVIFAGQQGWVYKTFIRAPLADGTASSERTRPSPRKAGSNSGASGGNRAWASGPHRLKPAPARLSTDQSTRDVQSRNQSGSGLVLLDAIEYLWKQIRPSALLPNSD